MSIGSEDALTSAVIRAKSGLRTDVARLIDALSAGQILVPLAEPMPDVPVGIDMEVGEELTLSPHVLSDADGNGWLALFTSREALAKTAEAAGWTTGDGALECCAVPGPVGLEVAVQAVDGSRIQGLVLNPSDPDAELLLSRQELASIAQNRALPLVGYVRELPAEPGEQRLIADPGAPPAPEIVAAIERVLAEMAVQGRFVLKHTFNAERDLEPHLTVNVLADTEGLDWPALAEKLGAALDGKIPPPGYVDLVLNDSELG